MEQRLEQLWEMIKFLYIFGAGAMGLCITGFFYILNTKDKFEQKINTEIKIAVGLLTEIKDAMVGTLDKKGLKTMVFEHEEFINEQQEGK